MRTFEVNKSFDEINARIKAGEAVVVTAEEMVGIVRKNGAVKAAHKVDVVTTGTFSPMCSSGARSGSTMSLPTAGWLRLIHISARRNL